MFQVVCSASDSETALLLPSYLFSVVSGDGDFLGGRPSDLDALLKGQGQASDDPLAGLSQG
jgi:hypothetical protein